MHEKEPKKAKNIFNRILNRDLLNLYCDQNVISFHVNNDGKLWKFTKKGYEFTGKILKEEVMDLINRISLEVDEVINVTNPILFVEFPNNTIFTGIIPPVSVDFPIFSIEKNIGSEEKWIIMRLEIKKRKWVYMKSL